MWNDKEWPSVLGEHKVEGKERKTVGVKLCDARTHAFSLCMSGLVGPSSMPLVYRGCKGRQVGA